MHKLCLVKNNALKKIVIKLFLITLITLPTAAPLHSFDITAALADIFCGLSIFKMIEGYSYHCSAHYHKKTRDKLLEHTHLLNKKKKLLENGVDIINKANNTLKEAVALVGKKNNAVGTRMRSPATDATEQIKININKVITKNHNALNKILHELQDETIAPATVDILKCEDLKYYTNERNKSLIYAGILGISAIGLYYLQKKL